MSDSPRTVGAWRTVDIVVTAAIAVAFGVVFWAWNSVWAAATPAFAAVPPAQNILYGVWLIPAVLAGLIVRKPGAALFAELVAASVSAILGSQWGLDTLVSGLIQGAAAEIVFAIARYRMFTVPVAILAAAATAAGAWIHDMPLYYPELTLGDQLVIGVFMVISGVVVAGLGAWWLMMALAQSGVLAQFPSGRAQTRV
ncbi:MAG TPA: ECF transporter S component [Candidatus Limnocylindria bacterium]|jgi:energy-coupling factor transport system substrate-specific component